MALLQVSCIKEAEQPVTRSVRVTFVVDFPLTKGAITSGAENAVWSLDLLVFRANGALESHVRVGSESYVEADLITGEELTYYVVANLPAERLALVSSKSEFLLTLTYLSDTAMNFMVMSGSGTLTLSGNSDVEVGPIGLDRYACKVSISDITVSWLSSFATPPSCVVNRVLLMNARTAEPLSGTATAAADAYWVNKLTDEAVDSSTMVGYLVYDNPALVVSSSAKTALGSVVYAMPNASTGDAIASDTPWTPRRSRVCVELLIDGQSNWYPIDLPAMERNTHYIVSELVINGPGTTAPDMGIDRTSVSFGIDVAAWTEYIVEGGTFDIPTPRFVGTFGGYMVAPSDMTWDGEKFTIPGEEWDTGFPRGENFNSSTDRPTNRSTYSWYQLRDWFGVTGSSYKTISNEQKVSYGGYDDWIVPSKSIQQKLYTKDPSVRPGSMVNGILNVLYISVEISDYTSTYCRGILLVPDGLTITGAEFVEGYSGDSYAPYRGTMTLAQIHDYVWKGCIFLPCESNPPRIEGSAYVGIPTNSFNGDQWVMATLTGSGMFYREFLFGSDEVYWRLVRKVD